MGEFFGEYIWRVQLQGNYIAIVEIEMRQAKIIEEEIQFFGSPKSVPCVVESVWMGGRWLISQWTGQESVQDTFSTNIRFGGSAKILCEWRQVAYLAPLMLILLGPALLATLRLGFSVNLLIHSFIQWKVRLINCMREYIMMDIPMDDMMDSSLSHWTQRLRKAFVSSSIFSMFLIVE